MDVNLSLKNETLGNPNLATTRAENDFKLLYMAAAYYFNLDTLESLESFCRFILQAVYYCRLAVIFLAKCCSVSLIIKTPRTKHLTTQQHKVKVMTKTNHCTYRVTNALGINVILTMRNFSHQ